MIVKIIKITLLAIIVLALVLIWLLPKTAIGRRLKMSEGIYLWTNLLGTFFGLAGLILTFILQTQMVSWHLSEVLVLPWVLLQMYLLMVRRAQASGEIVDEKQSQDMGQAAGLTLAAAILGMSILFILPIEIMKKGVLFYPYFLFLVMTTFSASTLYFFKKS
jgi:hypothetical protein